MSREFSLKTLRFVYYFIDKVTASESLINLFRGKQDIKGPEFKMQVF